MAKPKTQTSSPLHTCHMEGALCWRCCRCGCMFAAAAVITVMNAINTLSTVCKRADGEAAEGIRVQLRPLAPAGRLYGCCCDSHKCALRRFSSRALPLSATTIRWECGAQGLNLPCHVEHAMNTTFVFMNTTVLLHGMPRAACSHSPLRLACMRCMRVQTARKEVIGALSHTQQARVLPRCACRWFCGTPLPTWCLCGSMAAPQATGATAWTGPRRVPCWPMHSSP